MTPSRQFLARALERELIVHRVPDQARKLAEAIKLLSYDLDQDAAPVDEREDLQQALHMERRDFERAERLLVSLKILRVVRGGGRWWYELLPLPDAWPDRPAARGDGYSSRAPSFEAMETARAAWMRLERGVLSEPAQTELPIPLTSAQRYADGGAAEQGASENRYAAAAREIRRAGGNSPTADARLGEIPPTAKVPIGGNSPRSQTPAPTRVRHDHVPTSSPKNMDHDHDHGSSAAEEGDSSLRWLSTEQLEERLSDEGQYWLSMLVEILGTSAGTYRRTWLMRFCDRWQTEAFEALGETKRKIGAGERFTKGPGACANYLFKKYKRERTVHA